MRVPAIALLALISTAQAHAQVQSQSRDADRDQALIRSKYGTVCHYTIKGYPFEVAAGIGLCWRSPWPYVSEYGLLYCDPPFREVTSVRRGDPRCDQYEMRQ
jgi:hypothetical protein